MLSGIKTKLLHLLKPLLKLFVATLPILLLYIAANLISLGSLNLFGIVFNVDITELFPGQSYLVYTGFALILITGVIIYLLIKKGFASYGWPVSLFINLILLIIMLSVSAFSSNFLAEALLMKSFTTSFCKDFSNISAADVKDREFKLKLLGKNSPQEAQESLDDFCKPASKFLNFNYP